MISKNKSKESQAERIAQLTKDYEKLLKEQKDRILALRDENQLLQDKLKTFENSRSAIVAAMVGAQKASQEIISASKQEAQSILDKAEQKRKRLEEDANEYRNMLADLSARCDRIGQAIDQELRRTSSRGFGLELVASK